MIRLILSSISMLCMVVPYAQCQIIEHQRVRIIAAGDVSPYQAQGDLIERDVFDVLGPGAEWIAKADIAFVNLEAPVSGPNMKPVLYRKLPILIARPSLPTSLARAGFDVLSLANNHPFDWGVDGVKATLKAVKKSGLKYTGLGFDRASAHQPAIITIKGVRVAFIAATNQCNQPAPKVRPRPIVSWLNEKRLVAQIKALRSQVDVIVVSVHWGRSYKEHFNRQQARTARALAEAGADLILGHHPHVLQPVAFAEGKRKIPVAYSLGNFLFGGQQGARGRTIVLEVEFSARPGSGESKFIGARHLPLVVNTQRRLRAPKSKASIKAFKRFVANSPALQWRQPP